MERCALPSFQFSHQFNNPEDIIEALWWRDLFEQGSEVTSTHIHQSFI